MNTNKILDEAKQNKIFGAISSWRDIFWGDDRLEDAIDYCKF